MVRGIYALCNNFSKILYRSQPYSLLQEQPPNMMTGPSPNDYYTEYVTMIK